MSNSSRLSTIKNSQIQGRSQVARFVICYREIATTTSLWQNASFPRTFFSVTMTSLQLKKRINIITERLQNVKVQIGPSEFSINAYLSQLRLGICCNFSARIVKLKMVNFGYTNRMWVPLGMFHLNKYIKTIRWEMKNRWKKNKWIHKNVQH